MALSTFRDAGMRDFPSGPVLPLFAAGPNGNFHLLIASFRDHILRHGIPGFEILRDMVIALMSPNPDQLDANNRRLINWWSILLLAILL